MKRPLIHPLFALLCFLLAVLYILVLHALYAWGVTADFVCKLFKRS